MLETNKPIRILQVVAKMDLAGTETLLMSYYKRIDRNEVQFDFAVSSTTECAYDREIEQMGGRLFHYPAYKGYNHFSYMRWWNMFLSDHPEIKIIHGHIGSTAAIYLDLAKRHGRYTIAHSHSTWGENGAHAFLYKLFSYPTRYIADHFFGCSKQALIDRYGKKIANNTKLAEVMANAIDAKRFIFNEDARLSLRKNLGIDVDAFVIGTVGRFSPQKNPFMTLRVCEGLKRRNIGFKFLWFGQGELEDEIRREIDRLNLRDNVILAGVRKDIFNVLQAMDVFIFPSLWEGLGISCIEAQAAGLPTLCSETVPLDAKITDLFHYLPLDNVEAWVDEILRNKSIIRSNRFSEIEKSGYDIGSAAKRMQDFYINVYLNC